MRLLHRLVFGSRDGISGTVYGTIVVMAVIAAGSGHDSQPVRLIGFVVGSVLVLWLAHVYSDALAESIDAGRRLDRAEFDAVARRELAIPLAATGPVAALVLGGIGVLADRTAIRVALGIGVLILALQGVRFARLERLRGLRMVTAVAVNVGMGLVIVALEVLVAH